MITPPARTPKRRDAVARWAFVLGLVAVVIAFIPFGAFLGWAPGIAAIVLAIIALARQTSRKPSVIIALVLAVLGAPISGVVTGSVIGAMESTGADETTASNAPAVAVATPATQPTTTPTPPSTPTATPTATPTETPAAAPATVAVPAVVGLSGNAARDKLLAAGFDYSWSQTVIIASNWKVTAQSETKAEKGATIMLTVQPKPKPAPTTTQLYAVFKVWGSGDPDVTYSTDSDNIDGKIGETYQMKVSDDAMYYSVEAQLNGGGDIHCSVTINGVTRSGHAQGDYNICSAQLSSDPFTTGGWG